MEIGRSLRKPYNYFVLLQSIRLFSQGYFWYFFGCLGSFFGYYRCPPLENPILVDPLWQNSKYSTKCLCVRTSDIYKSVWNLHRKFGFQSKKSLTTELLFGFQTLCKLFEIRIIWATNLLVHPSKVRGEKLERKNEWKRRKERKQKSKN